MPPTPSLATTTRACVQAFTQLCTLLKDPQYEKLSGLTQSAIEDEYSRFRIWAGNLGALQQLSSPTSLDHRLRQSPKIARHIHELLENLKDSLQDVYAIASGARVNRQAVSPEDGEEKDEFDDLDNISNSSEITGELSKLSEAQDIFESAKETITSLFRLSIIIRNASPRDRFAKALAARQNPFNEQFDISYVGRKFPLLETKENQWLKERLGRAITQRRQFLRYAHEHRNEIGKEPNDVWAPEDQGDSKEQLLIVDRDDEDRKSKTALTNRSGASSTLAPTNASTPLPSALKKMEEDFHDDTSQTSYAISMGDDIDDGKLHLPRLADVAKGVSPFECPLCRTIQDLKKEGSWRKHAFRDLRPYICTFEKCDVKLFSDRRDWFEHELQFHRTQWRCGFCVREPYHTLHQFQEHLQKQHTQNFTEEQLQAVCEASQQPADLISASDCPFCKDWEVKLRRENPNIPVDETIVVRPAQFRHHVGSHMQQLALFAILRGYLEEETPDINSTAGVAVAGTAARDSSKSCSALRSFKTVIAPAHSYPSSGEGGILRAADDIKTPIEIYDPIHDVEALASALEQRVSDLQVFTDILPPLSHEQVVTLRDAYNLRVKVQGKGINLAEHIELKVSGNFGKICYLTTLGRWESEAYWANCWYQSDSSPRELLIEALTGRKNHEIREIKAAFRDKRYGDSLETYLERELKADKFRTALLIVLGDVRQEETDVWPYMSIKNDTDVLHNALNAGQGGETTMLNVVLKRSDAHLREVLRQYKSQYNDNFARAALKNSNNIVGEMIAYTLNGVTNKPARDALLINHALRELLIDHAIREFSSKGTAISSSDMVKEPRYEILISRLVRLHWDWAHMLQVKQSYYARYQHPMEEDIKNATEGYFSAFCLSLVGSRSEENPVDDNATGSILEPPPPLPDRVTESELLRHVTRSGQKSSFAMSVGMPLSGLKSGSNQCPPYYFRIDYMQEHPSHKPFVDAVGTWYPPKSLGMNQLIGGGVSGLYWYCDGLSISRIAYLPDHSRHFKTFSVYYYKDIFWTSRCDATAVQIGDGDDIGDQDLKDALEGEDEGWDLLSFDYDGGYEEQTYSSYITNAGEHDRLRTQRPDQIWPGMLLPERYHAPESSWTSAGHHQYGGLTGELPLFLALIAFSVNASDVDWALKTCFQNQSWRAHNVYHVRQDGRGMVVRVYCAPGRDANELTSYENGAWGKYFD